MFNSSFGSGNAFASSNNNNNSSSNGGLFGAKPTAPTLGGFGSNNATNSQSSGLFGSNNQTASTGNNLFGNNTSSNTTSGGLFGNTSSQNNSPGSGLFGNNNTQSNNLFGSKPNQSPASGGLFGNNNSNTANTASPSGGLFGNSSTNTTSTTGGGLFGNTQNNTSGGLFGNSNDNSAQKRSATGGLFGNNASNGTSTGSSLFGNKTSSTGGGLFGNNTSTTTPSGGLFGNNNSTAPSSGGLFGNNTNNNQPLGNLFGNNNQSNLANNLSTPAKQYSVKDLPKSLTDSTKTNKTVNISSRKRSLSSTNQPAGPIVNARSSLLDRFSTRFNSLKAESDFTSEGLFSPREDLIQSVLSSDKPSNTTINVPSKKTVRTFGSSFASSNRRTHQTSSGTDFLKLEVDPTRTEARRLKIFGEDGGAKKIRILGQEDEPVLNIKEIPQDLEEKQEEVEAPREPCESKQENGLETENIVNPTPSGEDDYWCSPSVEELSQLSLRQLSEVPDFSIGRKNYGTIHFEFPVDLTAFWSDLSGNLFGNIIRFNKNQTVEVYPNGSVPLGTGLNVPATITVEKVFPITKNGKKILDNLTTKDSELRLFIKKLKDINDMEFIAYDPINGSWTFRVEHFSIWGLVDEEIVVIDAESTKKSQNEPKTKTTVNPLSIDSQQSIKADSVKSKLPSKRLKPKSLGEDTFLFRKKRQSAALDNESSFIIPGSFMIDDDEDNNEEEVAFELHRPQNNILEDDLSADEGLISEDEQIPSRFDYDRDGSVLDDSIIELEEKQYEAVDVNEKDFAYLNNEPFFSVSDDWDNQLELSAGKDSAFAEGKLKLTTRYDAPFSKSLSPAEIDKLLFGDSSKKLKTQKKIEEELKIEHYKSVSFSSDNGLVIKDPSQNTSVETKSQETFFDIQDKSFITTIYKEHVQKSRIIQRKNQFPLVAPNPRLDFKFITDSFKSHPEFKISSVWKLASVIFDAQDITGELEDVQSSEISARVSDIRRREGLANWIKSEIKDQINALSSSTSDPIEQVFLSLVLNNMAEASKIAYKSQNPHLSVLVTLLGSNDPQVKYSAKKQIQFWTSTSALSSIPSSLLKIYYLLKGDPLHSDSIVNVVKNLSWKARLSLLLFYGNLNEPLSTLLATFVESNTSDVPEEDFTQLALLKLFVNENTGNYNTVEVFNSLNKSSKFDVSLQWYIFAILVRSTKQLSFGDKQTTSLIGDKLTLAYADQLFANELYEEGIFVLLHLDDDEQVNESISKLVAVNIEKFSKINGLIDNLNQILHVPTRLIIESKALHYRFTGDFWKEASYLLDAENYKEAHKAIINEVAPSAVINNGPQLKRLEEFISRFPEQVAIEDWNLGLLVYKNYIQSVKVNNESSLRYLVENLPNVKQTNFKIKVAVRLMSKTVASKLIESSRSEGSSFLELDKSKVLKLPLGEDAPYFAKDFAIEYFKQILTGV